MNITLTPAILPLDGITAAEKSRSGAKAYNCAHLKQAGFLTTGERIRLDAINGLVQRLEPRKIPVAPAGI